jgi:hypothetical protein
MFVEGKILVGTQCPAEFPAKGYGDYDITYHPFRFAVIDTSSQPNGPLSRTEISGYFQPGHTQEGEPTEEVVETYVLTVPLGTPISQMAHQIAEEETGDTAFVIGEELRRRIKECPCVTCEECPALNIVRLFEAIETARNRTT